MLFGIGYLVVNVGWTRFCSIRKPGSQCGWQAVWYPVANIDNGSKWKQIEFKVRSVAWWLKILGYPDLSIPSTSSGPDIAYSIHGTG